MLLKFYINIRKNVKYNKITDELMAHITRIDFGSLILLKNVLHYLILIKIVTTKLHLNFNLHGSSGNKKFSSIVNKIPTFFMKLQYEQKIPQSYVDIRSLHTQIKSAQKNVLVLILG